MTHKIELDNGNIINYESVHAPTFSSVLWSEHDSKTGETTGIKGEIPHPSNSDENCGYDKEILDDYKKVRAARITEYAPIRENISQDQLSKAYSLVNDIVNENPVLKIGDLSHIVLRETKKKVGYLGNETLELCNFGDRTLKQYHEKLEKAFNSIE
jgi:hypothetical protein